mmetsp:Transcript_13068/g.38430  ORF Transcript_13068/g.38430 Transcript_13068/m.38430 type:complete len:244 (-) Transcript_13068:185-916(-)
MTSQFWTKFHCLGHINTTCQMPFYGPVCTHLATIHHEFRAHICPTTIALQTPTAAYNSTKFRHGTGNILELLRPVAPLIAKFGPIPQQLLIIVVVIRIPSRLSVRDGENRGAVIPNNGGMRFIRLQERAQDLGAALCGSGRARRKFGILVHGDHGGGHDDVHARQGYELLRIDRGHGLPQRRGNDVVVRGGSNAVVVPSSPRQVRHEESANAVGMRQLRREEVRRFVVAFDVGEERYDCFRRV